MVSEDVPSNSLVRALLTDLYQLTMTYAHWRIGKVDDHAVFELFFRKNPFGGEYTIFCGLDECVKLLKSFQFTNDDIEYLKSTPALSHAEDGFFQYLENIHKNAMKSLKVYSVPEGTVVFPKCPLMIIEGPLGIGQLLETTLLNLINYPSLIATNASRMVLRAGPDKPCIEFGLRRAQGPDGACSASKYSYVGGFVATSNVQAGKEFGIPISGTHARKKNCFMVDTVALVDLFHVKAHRMISPHFGRILGLRNSDSFVQSFTSLEAAAGLKLLNKVSQKGELFLEKALQYRSVWMGISRTSTNESELAAFCAYACAFPESCLCLIDTYDTLLSGLPNFIFVAKTLDDFGYTPKGVRLDSGDLACLSTACQDAFKKVIREEPSRASAFGNLIIVASNDINEETLADFSKKEHGLTAYGIGTNLVTCQAQPALGCVYKLVEFNGEPRIKLSQELAKVTVPGRKRVYRLIGGPDDKTPLVDYMCLADEDSPSTEEAQLGIFCRNPFQPQDRLKVFASQVEPLHKLIFDDGRVVSTVPSLSETREFVLHQLHDQFSDSITRYEKPERYRVMVSPKLYQYLHELWEKNAPIPECK